MDISAKQAKYIIDLVQTCGLNSVSKAMEVIAGESADAHPQSHGGRVRYAYRSGQRKLEDISFGLADRLIRALETRAFKQGIKIRRRR